MNTFATEILGLITLFPIKLSTHFGHIKPNKIKCSNTDFFLFTLEIYLEIEICSNVLVPRAKGWIMYGIDG